jgi:hypothetical protein
MPTRHEARRRRFNKLAVRVLAYVGIGGAALEAGLQLAVPPTTMPPRNEAVRPLPAPVQVAPIESRTVFSLLVGASSTAELAALALDPAKPASHRYAAVRRLEETAPLACVPVADALARGHERTPEAEFLRTNAIATLYRLKCDESRSALERIRVSSPEASTLLALLEKGGH